MLNSMKVAVGMCNQFCHSLCNQRLFFQILVVLFLQEMLSFQDGFARHYAEGLDGCGLEQEAKVRHSFYTLIRRLTDAFHKQRRHDLDA